MLNRLYNDLAHLWPLLDPPEDYADEARFWRQALRESLGPGRHRALELGVGGGHLLSHLADVVDAAAVDISPRMLEHTGRLNPSVERHVGDMRTVRLGQRFRAVLIHDAVSYMLTIDDLQAVIATARAHLEPGGVLIMSPDFYRETFPGTTVDSRTRTVDGVEFTYVQYVTDPDTNDTVIETVFIYMTKRDGRLEVETDRHVTGLFALATWQRLMSEGGFEVETRPYPVYEDGGDGYLLVGTLAE